MYLLSLAEKTSNRTPAIWLVGCEIDPVEGGRITFEFGYVAAGFGASKALLWAKGRDPRAFEVTIPSGLRDMAQGQIFEAGSYFTIDKIKLD